MAHGNKTMPLDRYPYMDNDLKSKVGDFVTHEELTTALNDLSVIFGNRIEKIENELVVKTKPVELTVTGDFEIIKSNYVEFGNVVFIGMEVKLLSDLPPDQNKEIGTLDFKNGYKKPLFVTAFNGISTTGQLLKNSGKLQIRNVVDLPLLTGANITFSITYIGEDVM